MLLTNRGRHGGRSWEDKRAETCYGRNTNKGALEVEVIEDAVMYASESLEFELEVPCSEPFEESDFVIVQERLLKDVGDPLMLLCMRRRVIDVAGNGGLSVRYSM